MCYGAMTRAPFPSHSLLFDRNGCCAYSNEERNRKVPSQWLHVCVRQTISGWGDKVLEVQTENGEVSCTPSYECRHRCGSESDCEEVKKYRDCDARIRTIVNDYRNRNFIDYLRGIAHNFEMDP